MANTIENNADNSPDNKSKNSETIKEKKKANEKVKEVSLATVAFLNPLPLEQGTKHARKIYIGNLPPSINQEIVIAQFFNHTLNALLPNKPPGNVVIGTYLNVPKRFAFIENRSIEETTFCLSLDGIVMEDYVLKLRRPQDYNADLARKQLEFEMQLKGGISALKNAKTLGSLASTNVSMVSAAVESLTQTFVKHNMISDSISSSKKLLITNLPKSYTETEVSEVLLKQYKTKAVTVMKDNETQESKGIAVIEFRNNQNIDSIQAELNGKIVNNQPIFTYSNLNFDSNPYFLSLKNSQTTDIILSDEITQLTNMFPNPNTQLLNCPIDLHLPALSEECAKTLYMDLRFIKLEADKNLNHHNLVELMMRIDDKLHKYALISEIHITIDQKIYIEYETSYEAMIIINHFPTIQEEFYGIGLITIDLVLAVPPIELAIGSVQKLCNQYKYKSSLDKEQYDQYNKIENNIRTKRINSLNFYNYILPN